MLLLQDQVGGEVSSNIGKIQDAIEEEEEDHRGIVVDLGSNVSGPGSHTRQDSPPFERHPAFTPFCRPSFASD